MDVQRSLEHDLELLCLTGVEDKLQVFTANKSERISRPITHSFSNIVLRCVTQPYNEHEHFRVIRAYCFLELFSGSDAVHRRVSPSIRGGDGHCETSVLHKNTMSASRTRTQTGLPGDERTNHGTTALLLYKCTMFVQNSHLFVSCFYFKVDVRPTLEMLRNAGIKVTQRQKEALCKLRTLSLFHSCNLLFIHSVSLFLCNSYN